MYEKIAPTAQAIGTANHIPSSLNRVERNAAKGTLIIHRENSVINMGTNVSPAPRITPLSENMIEKII